MAIRQAESDDGTEICYRVTGPADARTLVLVHGWAVDHTCWGAAAEALARRYRIIAPDLRGHSNSDAPRPATTTLGRGPPTSPRCWRPRR